MTAERSIVIIDDNEDDIFLTKHVLKKAAFTNNWVSFLDANEAIRYFGRVVRGESARPLACLVDVKMPGYDGFDVLDALRASEELDAVSVFMLTSSDDPGDISKAAEKGAQCFLRKHPSVAVIQSVLEDAGRFTGQRATATKALFTDDSNLLPH